MLSSQSFCLWKTFLTFTSSFHLMAVYLTPFPLPPCAASISIPFDVSLYSILFILIICLTLLMDQALFSLHFLKSIPYRISRLIFPNYPTLHCLANKRWSPQPTDHVLSKLHFQPKFHSALTFQLQPLGYKMDPTQILYFLFLLE